MADFYKRRKKVCQLCQGKTINYKDVEIIKKYINEKGKILPRRATGACSKHQRELTIAIKRSRQVALLPYSAE